ncbi:MAG: hypothetical protein IJO97_01685 [Lachnospiraceae bacterium]|nr:hypothetical protein [Lachnospiraceae bacterium]
MKFIALAAPETITDKNILKEEFKAAKQVGEGRMGEHHFFYRYFISVKYTSYEKIRHAFLREESGECGEFLLKEFYLILLLEDAKEECKLRFERRENAQAVLAFLGENYPQIEIGYKKPDKMI